MKLDSGIVLFIILLLSFTSEEEKIVRMNETSIKAVALRTDTLLFELSDTIPNKSIIIYSDQNGYPLKYSRNIVTAVCMDGECRRVSINLYWNVCGRYLGFDFPKGEFLEKNKNDRFKATEYDRLHEILSDANSPLASYTIKELVLEKDSSEREVDAVSSATTETVLDHIVEGAVYTTHTLWHIVYGPTKHEIEKFSAAELHPDLSLLILNSNNISDQIWTLSHISAEMIADTRLQEKLMQLISGKDFYLAERSLKALKPAAITKEIQLKLASIFQSSGFIQRLLIIQKLKECDELTPALIQVLSSELNGLNSTLTKGLLDLYRTHLVKDDHTITELVKLLKNKNFYISNQASRYLESIDKLDKKTRKSLDKFKKNHS